MIKTTLADIGANITPHHFGIMRLLMEEGTLHVAEIEERLQIAKAQMTKLIDRLVDLDIVVRKTDEADRRAISIELTGKGRMVIEEHESALISATRDAMACFTDEKLEDLSDSLRKLRDILSKLR